MLLYSLVRLVTWVLQSLVLLAGLSYMIYFEVFVDEGKQYIYVILAAIAMCVIIGTDFHFTKVVSFYAKNPLKQTKLSWLNSDSDPQF